MTRLVQGSHEARPGLTFPLEVRPAALEDGPAAALRVHVAEDSHLGQSGTDRVQAAGLQAPLVQLGAALQRVRAPYRGNGSAA